MECSFIYTPFDRTLNGCAYHRVFYLILSDSKIDACKFSRPGFFTFQSGGCSEFPLTSDVNAPEIVRILQRSIVECVSSLDSNNLFLFLWETLRINAKILAL